jgi:hypothetical protein
MSNKNAQLLALLLAGMMLLGLLVSRAEAGNDTWTTTGPYGVQIWSIVANPNNSQIMYATGDGGVYKSSNGGNTWATSSTGLPQGMRGYCLAIAPQNDQIVFLGTLDNGLFKTTNGGDSWITTTLSIGAIRGVVFDPANSQVVYANSPFSIYKSIDGGVSWNSLQLPARAMVIDPNNTSVIYAGMYGGPGVSKSTDGGQSWSTVLPNIEVESMAIRKDNSQILYAGGSAGLFVSYNGGTSWSPVGNIGSLYVYAIALDMLHPGGLFVGVSGSGAGIYQSLDNGQTWLHMTNGIGSRDILSLYADSLGPQNIFAGTNYAGIWKYTISSVSQDYSVSINNGDLFTNQTTVTLTLTAPSGTTQMLISNDGGFGGAAWHSFANTRPWTITGYGSYVVPRTVYAKFKTNGQVSGVYVDDIILDQTPPTGSIQITSTFTDTVGSASITAIHPSVMLTSTTAYTIYFPLVAKNFMPGFRVVGLSLSATDDISGVGSMLIANDPNFVGAQWQEYAAKLNWYVHEKGTTTVYVKYRDRARNESQVYSAVTTAP